MSGREPSAVAGPNPGVRWWTAAVLGAAAGGLGWGIRGQYGHETGAMIAGLLLSLVLTLLFCPHFTSAQAARAVAWCTIAIGFGGSMTYGQTIGLTQDPALVGNWAALRWGLLGLAIKGGIWIGFAGVFFGMGLGGRRYRPGELLLLLGSLLGVFFLGVALINSPFDPAHRILPRVYFSAAWSWTPKEDLRPRPEVWGGLLLALLALLAYARAWRGDRLAFRLGGWAVLGGVIGFPLGQCLQAFHAWHPDLFRHGLAGQLDPIINWWNFMETTFGAVAGAALGLGTWFERNRIVPTPTSSGPCLPRWAEVVLVVLHGFLLVGAGAWSEAYGEIGLVMGWIPLVAVAAGRWWPYLLALAVTALPIAVKTTQGLVNESHWATPLAGTGLCLWLPMAAVLAAALWFASGDRPERASVSFTAPALILACSIYFCLNFAIFRLPWPWATWTIRTPNAMVFALCTVLLVGRAVWAGRSRPT